MKSTSEIPKEIEVLLCCARTRLDAQRKKQLKALLANELDWPYLLRMARKHRLRPSLYQHLNENCPEAVPESALYQLRQHFQHNCRRNLFHTGELLRLLNLFRAEGIQAIPYKGPALTVAVYGSLVLREFTDLDIMVPPENVSRVCELMRAEGYQQHFLLDAQQETSFQRYQSEHWFRHREKGTVVEIHWKFEAGYFSFPLDPSVPRARLQKMSLNGQDVWSYAPEDLFLLLCVHGAKHLWNRLRWIGDLAEMADVYREMNWPWVLEEARQLGVERIVLLGVHLAHELMGARFPHDLLAKASAEAQIPALAATVREHLGEEKDEPPGILESSRFHLKARERWQDRTRYCARLAVTPTGLDWTLMRLPSHLLLLYYPLRFARLATKYAVGLSPFKSREN